MDNKYKTGAARFGAAFVDGLVFIPFMILSYFFEKYCNKGIVLSWMILWTYLQYLYSILLHWKYGQTLGKMMLDVKVVEYFNEGKITIRQAFLRDFPGIILSTTGLLFSLYLLVLHPDLSIKETNNSYIAWASLIWVLAELITMFVNSKRRAIHDLIAGTVVIFKL